MPKTTSVALGDHFDAYVETRIREGRYGSASDVVRAGLELLEAEDFRVEALNAALDEGEASELIEDFDHEAFVAEMQTKYGQ